MAQVDFLLTEIPRVLWAGCPCLLQRCRKPFDRPWCVLVLLFSVDPRLMHRQVFIQVRNRAPGWAFRIFPIGAGEQRACPLNLTLRFSVLAHLKVRYLEVY